MGDISLQLALECTKNSKEVVDALSSVELSSDITTITSAMKTALNEDEEYERSSKIPNIRDNVPQSKKKVWILSERQFSCLRDLIKQSTEMINIHLKQCQFYTLNPGDMLKDNPASFHGEEMGEQGVKLEIDGQDEMGHHDTESGWLHNFSSNMQQDPELVSGDYIGDPGKFENTFNGENKDIKNNSLAQPDFDHLNLDMTNSLKRKRKKKKCMGAESNIISRKKRKKSIRLSEYRLNEVQVSCTDDRETLAAEVIVSKKEPDIVLSLDIEGKKQARERLKELIRIICLWPHEQEIPVDYDILHSQSPSHYGLNSRGGGKPYIFELVMLSLESPIFIQRRTCVKFYSKLFRVPLRPWKIKIRNMYLFWERGGNLNTSDKYRFPCSSKVLKELILNGFESFNPFTDHNIRDYENRECTKSLRENKAPKEVKTFEDLFMCTPSSRLNCPAPNFFVAPKNRRHAHDGIQSLAQTSNPVLDWLTENQINEINVTCNSRCYGQGAFFQQHVGLIPDFSLNHVFAMVGIIVDNEASDLKRNDISSEENENHEKNPHCFQAKILARSASCSIANPACDFDNLYNVVTKSLGLSYHDVFRNSYSLPTTQSAKTLHDHYFKVPTKQVYAELEALGHDGVQKKMEEYNLEIGEVSARNQHTTLVELPQNKCIKLTLNENKDEQNEFDFSKVNNISVLMGLDPANIQIRSLLSEEAYLASFSMKKSTATSADANEILPWVLTDLFCTFHGFTTHEIFEYVPEYEKKFTHLRDTYNKMRACKEILNRQNIICQVMKYKKIGLLKYIIQSQYIFSFQMKNINNIFLLALRQGF